MDENKSIQEETDARYDAMTDEEYYSEMEQKVEYYKKAYPDMYAKAEEWIKMLEHSEVYKNNSGNTESTEESSSTIKANDIQKSVLFHGLTEEDLSLEDVELLNKVIPDWKTKVTE